MGTELQSLIHKYENGFYLPMYYFSDDDIDLSPWGACTFKDDDTNEEFTSLVSFLTYSKSKFSNTNLNIEKLNEKTVRELIKINFELDKLLEGNSLWVNEQDYILLLGNYYKFSQDIELKNKLLSTHTDKLCYCSKTNLKWGIGLGKESISKEDPRAWNGENQYGFALEKVRGLL